MKIKYKILPYIFPVFLLIAIYGLGHISLRGPVNERKNPEIFINGGTGITCKDIKSNSIQKFELEVEYTDALSTEDYLVNSISYAPEIPFEDVALVSNKLNFKNVDEFSTTAINFFPFGFLEDTTSRLAVGENGVISLDPTQAGLLNLREPSSDIPETSLTRYSIFAAHTDVEFDEDDPNSGVFYSIVGTEPARKLVITYLNGTIFNCNSSDKYNVQVVLEETSNNIQIFVKNKPKNCGIIDFTAIGIMDQSGSKGFAAPGRQMSDGNWSAKNEAWEFSPNGGSGPKISWYKGAYSSNNPVIGTGDKITVNASPSNLFYTVRIEYPNGEILIDEIRASEFIPETQDISQMVCSPNVDLTKFEVLFSVPDPINFDIQYYKDAGLTSRISSPTNFNFTDNTTTVYAKVINQDDPSCFEAAEILLFKTSFPVPKNVNVCDVDGDDIEKKYDLSLLDEKIFGVKPSGEVKYFLNETDTNPVGYTDVVVGTQVWLELTTGSCVTKRLGPINLQFAPLPTVSFPGSIFNITTCDEKFDYREPLDGYPDWTSYLKANGLTLSDPNLTVDVYKSENDAKTQNNPIADIVLDIKNKDYNKINNSISANYYIRVENDEGCENIIPFPVDIRFYGVKAINYEEELCKGSTITADLECYLPDMLQEMYDVDGKYYNSFNDIKSKLNITYHNTEADANSGRNSINSSQTIDLSKGSKSYYVRFELCRSCNDGKPCYIVKSIDFKSVTTEPNKNIEVCRTTDGNQYVHSLAIFEEQLVGSPFYYDILFFTSYADSKDNSKAITSYTFTGSNDLFVKIKRRGKFDANPCVSGSIATTCEDTYKVNFQLGAKVKPINFSPQVYNDVCDNNADMQEPFDLTQFESKLVSVPANFEYWGNYVESAAKFIDYIGNPSEYMLKIDNTNGNYSTKEIVYVKIEYEGLPCYQVAKLDLTFNFKKPIITEKAYLCNCLPAPGLYADFNLSEAIPTMFDDTTNTSTGNALADMNIEYYEDYEDAEQGINNIITPNNFNSTKGIQDLFVKFQHKTSGCYSIDTIQIKNLVNPIPKRGELKYCDTNFNGFPEINLNKLNEIVMPGNTESYFFDYYLTEEDADNDDNSLTNESISGIETEEIFYEFKDAAPDKIYVRVSADNGTCPSTQLNFCSNINFVELFPGNPIDISKIEYDLPDICDTFDPTGMIGEPTYNDGIANGIDLTVLESQILSNINSNISNKRILYYETIQDIIADPYPYGSKTIPSSQLTYYENNDDLGKPIDKVFAKIETDDDGWCPILVELNINVLPGPKIAPQPNYYLCPGGTTDIYLNNPDNDNVNDYQFEWTLPDGSNIYNVSELMNADQIGNYNVKIINKKTGCESPNYTFTVEEVPPPTITELQVIDEKEIVVTAIGDPKFTIEYSIDGINFQDSNVFPDLNYGIYTLWARYKENLECISEPKQTVLLQIYNIITPNNDGKNECITIFNLNVFGDKETKMYIYDRYGKKIFSESSNDQIKWCGKYLGRKLNSTDYWYQLFLPDGRIKSGHITIKNF